MTAAVRETIIPWPRQHQLRPGAGTAQRTEAPSAAALLDGRGPAEVSRGSRGGDVAVSQAAAFSSPKSSFPVQEGNVAAASLLRGGSGHGDVCPAPLRSRTTQVLSRGFYQPRPHTPPVPVLQATGTASWKARSAETWFGRRCHLTAGELHPLLRNATRHLRRPQPAREEVPTHAWRLLGEKQQAAALRSWEPA